MATPLVCKRPLSIEILIAPKLLLKIKIDHFVSIEIDFKNNFCAINILIESGRLQTTGVAIYRPWLKNLGSLELQYYGVFLDKKNGSVIQDPFLMYQVNVKSMKKKSPQFLVTSAAKLLSPISYSDK